MGKLAKIRSLTEEAKNLVEEFQRDLNEAIEEYNAALKEFEVVKESVELSTLKEIDEALEGMEHLPQIPLKPVIECEDEGAILREIEPEEPYEVEEPRSGTFAAKFWGFVVAVLLFLGFGAVGAYLKNLNLDLSMIDMKFIEQAYGFYSDLITGTSGSAPALGIVLAAAVSILVGYLVYLAFVGKAASMNLQRAEAIFEAAKSYVEQKEPFLHKVKTLKEFFQKALATLKSARIFGDEYEARAKRIRFFEGDDFEALSSPSKTDIIDLCYLKNDLEVIVASKPYEQNDMVAPEVVALFDDVDRDVAKIKQRIYG
ncbi:MAG: hypothetical protein C6H99_05265 [Epsilonproteobacteria bacterium]|nr:hypothetical protein [Campylobacterota bacterium]NPA63999.1 hypothetical protein [Campylobacterota bacterium]